MLVEQNICIFSVERAFDNTSPGEIRIGLIRKRVGNTLTFWLGRMLENRRVEVLTGTDLIVINTTQTGRGVEYHHR